MVRLLLPHLTHPPTEHISLWPLHGKAPEESPASMLPLGPATWTQRACLLALVATPPMTEKPTPNPMTLPIPPVAPLCPPAGRIETPAVLSRVVSAMAPARPPPLLDKPSTRWEVVPHPPAILVTTLPRRVARWPSELTRPTQFTTIPWREVSLPPRWCTLAVPSSPMAWSLLNKCRAPNRLRLKSMERELPEIANPSLLHRSVKLAHRPLRLLPLRPNLTISLPPARPLETSRTAIFTNNKTRRSFVMTRSAPPPIVTPDNDQRPSDQRPAVDHLLHTYQLLVKPTTNYQLLLINYRSNAHPIKTTMETPSQP